MPRIVNFEGRRITVPDDASDDEVAGILSASQQGPTPDMDPMAGSSASFGPPTPQPRSVAEQEGRSFKIGLQNAGTGLADIAGAPVDLATGAINTGIGAVNDVSSLIGRPTNIQGIRHPFGGSESIQSGASKVAQAFGYEPVREETYSPGEKLQANIARFGTQAMTAGGALATSAARAAPSVMPSENLGGRIADVFRRPYREAPGRTFAGDVAGGVGAGTAVDALDQYVPKESPYRPIAETLAVLLGGGAGATALGVAEGSGRAAQNIWNHRTDVNVPKNPETGAPYSVADAERAARAFQGAAHDPATAASEIRTNATDLKTAPLSGETPVQTGEMPTSGLLSRDPGLVSTEYNRARRDPSQGPNFIARDQGVKEGAAKRVESLKDPNADPAVVPEFIEAEAARLAQARDEAALPLLRAAEAKSLPPRPQTTPAGKEQLVREFPVAGWQRLKEKLNDGTITEAEWAELDRLNKMITSKVPANENAPQVNSQAVADLIDSKLADAKRPPVRAALTEVRRLLNKTGTEDLDTTVAGLYETRKAINDVIEGRGENSTGRFAKSELIDVRKALDAEINKVSPEFGQYLQKYREGSEAVNAYTESPAAQALTGAKNNDVRNVAADILNSKAFGNDARIEEINKLVAANPRAKEEWRNSVADALYKRVASDRQSGETREIQFSRLAKEFKDNEQVLASVMSPEEMNTLRQGHKMLEYFKESEKRASTGSNTADAQLVPGWVQLAFRHVYGDLKGGGIIKRFKLLAEQLPSNRASAEEIAHMAWFNPDLAAYLLEKPLRGNPTAANVPLRRLEALAAGGRASGERDDQ